MFKPNAYVCMCRLCVLEMREGEREGFYIVLDNKTYFAVHCVFSLTMLQMVYVSISASRPPRSKTGEGSAASYLPAPCRDNIPMMLLLRQPASNQLFSLLQLLSDFRPDTSSDKQVWK